MSQVTKTNESTQQTVGTILTKEERGGKTVVINVSSCWYYVSPNLYETEIN